MAMAEAPKRKRGRPPKKKEPTVEHERIQCIKCKSTDLERICESRKPLITPGYTVRWYRRQCRACRQIFITKEKDYTV